MKKSYLSTSKAAEILGISRIAVFNRIKRGELKAAKIGRNYVIDPLDLGLSNKESTEKMKTEIRKAVKMTFDEYGEALKKLGRE